MAGQIYEVRVKGSVPDVALVELGATGLAEEPKQTILTTYPIDQAGLHGILERLRDLGLEVIEIRRAPETP